MYDDVKNGAKLIAKDVLNIKKGEKVLIAINEAQRDLVWFFWDACLEYTDNVRLHCYGETGSHGAEPTGKLISHIEWCDVFIFANTYSLSHTEARKAATNRGARGVSMPMIEEKLFASINTDYVQLKIDSEKMHNAIQGVDKVKIEFVDGGEIEFSIRGRLFECLYGDFAKKGEWGNMPEGEICGAPIIESANGIITFNHWEAIGNKGTIKVVNGRAVGFAGGGKKLEAELIKHGDKAFNIAELGIGTNRKAVVCGNVLQDEKVFGTVHIAFGDNTSYDGGTNDASIHEDVIISEPTLWFDGKLIIEKGVWCFDD